MAENQKSKSETRKGGYRRRPGFQMRISTKYAPRKPADGQARSCIKDTSLTHEQMLELYRYLKLTRLVEERIVNLYRQTKVVGGVYRSLGQEATAVGSAYALRADDFITPIIRDLGACFVKGIRPREILAQYMAKAWGPSGGKDLNVHFGYLDRGGDGGASTGAFYEGLNFAAVQRLPLIVIAEHNQYAYSTPTNLQTAVRNLAEKAAAFGIPGYIVDGNDVIACYEVTKQATDYARTGRGAVLIEAKTYRRKGHAEHDDQRYVPDGEIEYWEKHNDPIDRFERFLLDQKIATKESLEEITAEVTREIDEDSEWAESSPMPEPQGAAYGVFDNSMVPPAFRPRVLEK